MGTVYEAENTLTLKRAAIKWLHPRLVAVEETGKRLLNEARAMARIHHRNVVDIYDVVIEQHSVFLVMELLIGEQLSELLARERLAVHEVIALLLPAMRGVAAAHAAGVVHRDIKPDNILLVREGDLDELTPKVIDFGISRLFEADNSRLTRSGMTMGTPRYVSYEQLRGIRDVDKRADVYAFGVILYECLLGQPPYDANSFGEQAIAFVTTEPASPRSLRPELPEALERVICSAIAKERERRTPSMEVLIAELSPFADDHLYPSALRTYAPRGPAVQTSEVLPSQTTAPAASRTPVLHHVEQPTGEAAHSFPSPRAPSRKRPWLALFGVLGLAAGASSLLISPASRQATRPAAVPPPAPAVRPADAPARHVWPVSPSSPLALGPRDVQPEPPEAGSPEPASELSDPLVPTGETKPVRASSLARASRREVPSVFRPSAAPAASEPATPSERAGSPDGAAMHRAGPMQSTEF